MFRVCDGNTVLDTHFNYIEAWQWAQLGLYTIELWDDCDEVWTDTKKYGMFSK